MRRKKIVSYKEIIASYLNIIMKKRSIIICLIMLVIIVGIIVFINSQFKEVEANQILVEYKDDTEEISENEKNQIADISQDLGFQANENIYEMAKEYDGREVVVVKSNIKYKVALAGSIKGQKPEYSEINSVLEKAPKHTGIWIEKNSREKFLEIIKKIARATYTINQEGFLIQKENWMMNEYDQSISKKLNDEKLHVFDISSITYVVDDVTGEIQEYPFEEMDPYTEYEYFIDDNKEMFIISENLSGKVSQEECLKKIFE
mgnify:CR=1 FL=1